MHDSKTKKSEASNTGLEQACSARRFFNHSCHVQLPHEQTQYLIAQAEEAEGGLQPIRRRFLLLRRAGGNVRSFLHEVGVAVGVRRSGVPMRLSGGGQDSAGKIR